MLKKYIFNKEIQLFSERGVYIPHIATLLVTDTHFGKDNTFSKNGIILPQGVTDSDLNRLSTLITKTNPEQVIFLGDLIHAKDSKSDILSNSLKEFRKQFLDKKFILVEGNHDKTAGVTFDELGFNIVTDKYEKDDFVFLHKPEEIEGKYVFAGHIHPGYSLKDVIRSKITFPCFHLTENYTVLPAFSEFTGKYRIKKTKNDSIIVILEDELLEL